MHKTKRGQLIVNRPRPACKIKKMSMSKYILSHCKGQLTNAPFFCVIFRSQIVDKDV